MAAGPRGRRAINPSRLAGPRPRVPEARPEHRGGLAAAGLRFQDQGHGRNQATCFTIVRFDRRKEHCRVSPVVSRHAASSSSTWPPLRARRRSARMRSSRTFIPRMRPASPDGQVIVVSAIGVHLLERARPLAARADGLSGGQSRQGAGWGQGLA